MPCSPTPVGVIHSCFNDKFGVPRQPGLVSAARARLELFPPYNSAETCLGLDGFSHLWITFIFHHCLGQRARLSVRPPRLGGNRRLGVFASRSTHRPNPVGLSVVTLDKIERRDGTVSLWLRGVDLVDGTPVLDIKPYLPALDARPEARADYAQAPPVARFEVRFTPIAERQCREYRDDLPELRRLIESVLGLDPRPAYHADRLDGKRYVVTLHGLEVCWRVVHEGVIEVQSITGTGVVTSP